MVTEHPPWWLIRYAGRTIGFLAGPTLDYIHQQVHRPTLHMQYVKHLVFSVRKEHTEITMRCKPALSARE